MFITFSYDTVVFIILKYLTHNLFKLFVDRNLGLPVFEISSMAFDEKWRKFLRDV